MKIFALSLAGISLVACTLKIETADKKQCVRSEADQSWQNFQSALIKGDYKAVANFVCNPAIKSRINEGNARGDTPLHLAITFCAEDQAYVPMKNGGLMVKSLIEAKADMHARNKSGYSPFITYMLHHNSCTNKSCVSALEVLMDKGVKFVSADLPLLGVIVGYPFSTQPPSSPYF